MLILIILESLSPLFGCVSDVSSGPASVESKLISVESNLTVFKPSVRSVLTEPKEMLRCSERHG